MNRFRKLIARFSIPNGDYCDGCPFWSMDESKPERMNGYCSYLGKGDWDFYGEMPDKIEVEKRQPDGSYKHELIDKAPIFGSLLWDRVKECGVKLGPFQDRQDNS
jgi:hypothetical protein